MNLLLNSKKNKYEWIIFFKHMSIEIGEIKQIRKKLGMTQGQLASHAQVSQSLIAKIEAGRLDPTYSNAQKIFGALNNLSKEKEAKAEDIMTNRIISISPQEDIKQAIAKMKKNNISQMPVIEGDKSIGLISESTILTSILEKKKESIVSVMEDSPPVISKNTSISVISDLLKFYSLILVSDNGKLKGVITKSDILSKLFN
ncbi:MAG: CBS domain-containing protein [Nanoarchaeota archaeon]